MTWFHTIIRALHTHSTVQFLVFASIYAISSEGNSTIDGRHKIIACLRSERAALVKFMDGISHGHCGLMISWGNLQNGNPDCCTWNGVTCNRYSGRVTGLVLNGASYNRLGGCLESQVISSTLGDLKHLTYLDLSYNNFRGVVIPNFIGNLINLTELYLSSSHFGGEVPNHLGNLTRLTSLDLSLNDGLYVKNMHWLSRLTMLKDINLGGTNLSKANDWSQVVGSLRMLESLKMDGCGLSSPVSSSFLQSPNLYMISLSRNGFTGSLVFHWPFNSSHFAKVLGLSLHHLDLSSNSFQGPIPNTIGNLVSLTFLNLSHNSFSGILPFAIQKLKSLSYLDLSDNLLLLSVSLENTFKHHECLVHLDLSRNLISGTLPHSLRNFVCLEYLDLSRNSFSGTISNGIAEEHYLTYLSLSHNLLNGTIVSIITNLGRVSYLDLSYNLLEGPINDTIVNLDSLAYLDLSHNSLSGTIPDTIKNLYSLTYLNLSHNSLSGTIPSSIGDLYTLAYLDLSSPTTPYMALFPLQFGILNLLHT